jgi:hypothetical protein
VFFDASVGFEPRSASLRQFLYMQTIRETAVRGSKFCFYERKVFFFKESLVQPKKISTKGKQTHE